MQNFSKIMALKIKTLSTHVSDTCTFFIKIWKVVLKIILEKTLFGLVMQVNNLIQDITKNIIENNSLERGLCDYIHNTFMKMKNERYHQDLTIWNKSL